MTSPSISAVETTGPWQGSLSGTGLPDNSDDGAVIIAAEQAAGATGILVSYADGHLAHLPAADPAPVRQADLRSLVSALQKALANPGLDPLWQQVLAGAQQALQ